MPDGATHFAANALTGVGMTFAAAWYAPDAFAPVAVGSIIGAFITPDMDVDHTTETEKLMRKVPVVGTAIQAAWLPYALNMKHRGPSHWPVLGTLGRAAYLALILAAFYFFVFGVLGYFYVDTDSVREFSIRWITKERSACMIAAWCIQDFIHWLMDGMFKG